MDDPVDGNGTNGTGGGRTVGDRRFGDRRLADRRRLGEQRTDGDRRAESARPGDERLWHVTVTVTGPPVPVEDVRSGLERLSLDHPFLMSGRYAADRAEVRYWEEAPDVHDALAMALRLWGEHRATAGLPAWSIVGLEVLDRETYRLRGGPPALLSPGVRPF